MGGLGQNIVLSLRRVSAIFGCVGHDEGVV